MWSLYLEKKILLNPLTPSAKIDKKNNALARERLIHLRSRDLSRVFFPHSFLDLKNSTEIV